MRVIPITAFLSALCAGASFGQPGSVVVAPDGRAADSVLSAAARDGFTGVAFIRRGGDVILRKGYGFANAGDRIPFSPTTVVQIGSNTKDFTAVAILQLAERGRLTLDDPIAKHLAGVPDDKKAITIRHLLDHRAGLPIGFGDDFEPIGRDAFLTRVMASPLEAKPGERNRYSNAGSSILAAIIERVSGQGYDQFVKANILDPLGLHDTGFLLPGFDRRRLAHGYAGGRDQGTMLDKPHAADGPYWNLRGNGGMLSTVDDMAAFYRALYGTETLLKRTTRQERFPDGPVVLAGSDLVNYFLYSREPGANVEVILVSTTAESGAPQLEGKVMEALGFGARGRGVRAGGPGAAPKAIELPDTPLGRAFGDYLKMFNDGDASSRLFFFTQRVVAGPNAPAPPEQRAARTQQMRGDLGRLTPVGITSTSPAKGELRTVSETGEEVVVIIEVETSAPNRIVSIGLRVG